jgi:hypothetical protein
MVKSPKFKKIFMVKSPGFKTFIQWSNHPVFAVRYSAMHFFKTAADQSGFNKRLKQKLLFVLILRNKPIPQVTRAFP